MNPEMETQFDIMIKKVIPFLIFPPSSFREEIAENVNCLYQSLKSNDKTYFYQLIEKLNNGIDKREPYDNFKEVLIFEFASRWKSIDEKIIEIKEDIIEIKRKMNNIEKSKEISTIIEKEKELSPIIEKDKKRPAISENEIQQLELIKNYLKTNERITNIKAKEILGVNTSQASKLLKKLVKENIIKQMGKKRGTYYERM